MKTPTLKRRLKLAFSAATMLLSAGTLSAGTITVNNGAVVAGSNYNTIQAAYDYIKGLGTIAESYDIVIQDTYAGESTYPISLTAIAGASASNTITIKPASGKNITIACPNKTTVVTTVNTTASTALTVPDASNITSGMTICGSGAASAFQTVSTVTGNDLTFSAALTAATTPTLFIGTAGTQTIVFDGAQFVTIDGVARTGATTLTIQNPNNIAAQTILFKGGASNNKVRNCFIKGANMTGKSTTDSNTGTICMEGATNGNTIENNDVCNASTDYLPTTAVLLNNSSASASEYNTIQNNNIYNSFCTSKSVYATAACVSMAGTTANARILNNNIYWTINPTSPANKDFSAIFQNASTTATECRVEGNVVGGDGSTDALAVFTTNSTFNGINVCSNSTVKNNVVKNMNVTITVAKNYMGFSITDVASGLTDVNAFSGNTVSGITSNCTGGAYNLMGIYFWTGTNTKTRNIANNTIYNLTSLGAQPNARGIGYSGTTATQLYSYTGNRIYNITAGTADGTPTSTAIYVFGLDMTNNANIVEKNQIYNLKTISTNATASYVYGIRVTGGNTTGTYIQNNIVALGVGLTSNHPIYGILQNNATATDNKFFIYHNSVYIGGESSATTGNKNSFAFANVTANPPATLDVRNNIFVNQRVIKSTEFHYAIGCKAANTITTCTKNLYQYATNTSAAKNAVGTGLTAAGTGTVTASYADVTTWSNARTTASASADESIDNLAPGFTDATAATPNLHITSSSSPANGSGDKGVALESDIEGLLRSDYTPSDLGAYVIAGTTAIGSAPQKGLCVYAANKAVVFENLNGQTASFFSSTGQLIKTVVLTSDKVAVPCAAGFYVVNAAAQTVKVLVK